MFTIREACHALGVSESGFYAHRHKHSRLRRQQNAVLVRHLKEVFENNYHCYGSPRLVKALFKRGLRCGKPHRLMKQEGFVYLAATVDAFTRRCVGWCIRDKMGTALIKEAAHMVFAEA